MKPRLNSYINCFNTATSQHVKSDIRSFGFTHNYLVEQNSVASIFCLSSQCNDNHCFRQLCLNSPYCGQLKILRDLLTWTLCWNQINLCPLLLQYSQYLLVSIEDRLPVVFYRCLSTSHRYSVLILARKKFSTQERMHNVHVVKILSILTLTIPLNFRVCEGSNQPKVCKVDHYGRYSQVFIRTHFPARCLVYPTRLVKFHVRLPYYKFCTVMCEILFLLNY